MRHALFGDEALVGGIEHDDGVVGVGVIDPCLQLLGVEHRAGGVVRAAQVDDVRAALGQRRAKAVLGGGGHVHDVRPALGGFVVVACAAGHGVGIHVHGIHRVAHGYHVVDVQDVADVAAVGLCAVGDEDLVIGDVDAERMEIALGDGGAQEIVTLLGAVAVEGLGLRHVLDGGVHGLDDGRDERTRDVADAHLDELRLGMRLGIRGGTAGDLGEQIAAGKFLVIRVDLSHEGPPCTFGFRKRRRRRDRRSFHTGPFCGGFPRDFRNVT